MDLPAIQWVAGPSLHTNPDMQTERKLLLPQIPNTCRTSIEGNSLFGGQL